MHERLNNLLKNNMNEQTELDNIVTQPRQTRCSSCHQHGHNRRSCTNWMNTINNPHMVRCCYCREDGHSITECNHSSINILRVNIRKKYIKKISENIIYNIYNENNNYNYLLSQL